MKKLRGFGMHCELPGWIHIWDALIDVGSNLTSRQFAVNGRMMHIRLETVPKETPKYIGLVERYHDLLRNAFQVIENVTPATLEELSDTNLWHRHFENILKMACKRINDTVGLDGLITTLLVYGV